MAHACSLIVFQACCNGSFARKHFRDNHIINIKVHKEIPIEDRNSEELSHIVCFDEAGKIKKIQIYPKKSKAMNLAFDVTPAKYVTGLITEKGLCQASTEGLKKLFK